LQTHPGQDVSIVLPVCSNEAAPTEPPPRGTPYGSSQRVDFVEVSHILGCQKEETVTVTLDGEPIGGRDGNGKAPKTIARGLELGSEAFQVRAVVAVRERDDALARAVRVPLWGHDPPAASIAERLAALGSFSLARAEFYHDGSTARDDWMWNMGWKARFRVFRIGDDRGDLSRACSQALSAARCNDLLSLFDQIDHLANH
jgi:hypothetical protein